jgi:hypothetical protein
MLPGQVLEEAAGIGALGEVPSLEVVTSAEKVAEEVVVVVVAMEVVGTVVGTAVVAMGVMVVEIVHGIDNCHTHSTMRCAAINDQSKDSTRLVIGFPELALSFR